jgi:hypothetical protein
VEESQLRMLLIDKYFEDTFRVYVLYCLAVGVFEIFDRDG